MIEPKDIQQLHSQNPKPTKPCPLNRVSEGSREGSRHYVLIAFVGALQSLHSPNSIWTKRHANAENPPPGRLRCARDSGLRFWWFRVWWGFRVWDSGSSGRKKNPYLDPSAFGSLGVLCSRPKVIASTVWGVRFLRMSSLPTLLRRNPRPYKLYFRLGSFCILVWDRPWTSTVRQAVDRTSPHTG